jgi:Endodeoxyribonuclease RusA
MSDTAPTTPPANRFSAYSDVVSEGIRTVTFTVHNKMPVLERPKLAFRGRHHPVLYDSCGKKKTEYSSDFQRFIVNDTATNPVWPMFCGSEVAGVELNVRFFLQRRADDYIGKTDVLKETAQRFPKKKDIDNLLKFLLDAMNGWVYGDDSCVTAVTATKQFIPEELKSDGPFAIIIIRGAWMH